MTPDIVTEARQLLDAATPGPWEVRSNGIFHYIVDPHIGSDDVTTADIKFIAAAPRLVTDLVAEVERLRTALDQRTDPELAARLELIASTEELDYGSGDITVMALRKAARLLGGDQ